MRYVVTRKPESPLAGLNDFDRIFRNFWNDVPSVHASRLPKVDIREEKDGYVLEAELPGLSENDVNVNIEKHVLTISSTVEKEHSEESKKDESNKEESKKAEKPSFLIRERASQSFSRSFRLPEGVNEDEIKGEFRHGILTLTIPRVPVKQPKRIEVKMAS